MSLRNVFAIAIVTFLTGCSSHIARLAQEDPYELGNPEYLRALPIAKNALERQIVTNGKFVSSEEERLSLSSSIKDLLQLSKQGHVPSKTILNELFWVVLSNLGNMSRRERSLYEPGKSQMSEVEIRDIITQGKAHALSQLNMAARTGYLPARDFFVRLELPVPPHDLLTPLQLAAKKERVKNKAVARSIARGILQGMATTTSNTTNSYAPGDRGTIPQNSCSSDFDCGIGHRCLKNFGELSGICAKTVNEYGSPTYDLPEIDSIGVGQGGNCSFTTDCPLGFDCRKNAGQLYGFCIKQ